MKLAVSTNVIPHRGPFIPFRSAAQPRRAERTRCQAHPHREDNSERLKALLSTTVALSIGLGALLPSAAQADDVYQKRREDMERRRELLTKTREKALATAGSPSPAEGGEAQAETKFESSATAPAVSSAEAVEQDKVKAATERVTQSNAEREREAARMKQNLKSSLKSYEASAQRNDQKLKPGKSADIESPSWLKDFIGKNQKAAKEALPTPPSTTPSKPETESEPSSSLNATLSSPAVDDSPSRSSRATLSDSLQGSAQGDTPAPSPAINPPKATPPAPLPDKPSAVSKIPSAPPTAPPAKTSLGVKKPAVGVQPIQGTAQKKTPEAQKGKQRGPLPMTLAQLLVLAAFGGLGYLTFFREEEVNEVLAKAGSVVADAYGKIDKSSSKAASAGKSGP